MYDDVAAEFETHRPKMKAVARRLLASDADTDDAVQEAWVRLQRTDRASIDNLEAWLMTTVGRIGLNQLRSRATRREMPLDHVSESSDPLAHPDPEIDVLLAETVGSALQVVVDTLTPAERVAFVLHDAFGFPYAEIGRVLNRSSEAARQLASRGRGRIRHTDPSDLDSAIPAAEQIVVDAFLSAAKGGDLNALVDVLDPQIVERIAVAGQPVIEVRGAESVASRAREFSSNYTDARPAIINGRPGWIAYRDSAVYSVGALAITDGRIDRMDVILDPARLRQFHIRTPATGS
ncbi:MAG TPA: sigma-70 family RNA polymerase sigma factor [Gordonia sp. (in: high G+C Gram-positive bacteria)]|nr:MULTISPECIES: sigma-70 family RNA polymerase sigma factor [unclassified Gordonia (in: high G+C Gram-positive bacteria)]HNP56939.1 sigma-70 family RNA polymerase sigma factor [Gordonia sp. (in: high G+C Gram-positive bacteria)]HRC50383.1 sigma-70 family RNA polymerase sigma factor [Gordonia sp. (in: high G+C Gram-positive bacteria)]